MMPDPMLRIASTASDSQITGMNASTIALLMSALLLASPALASSSSWYASEGGRIRLVTTGKPDNAGRIQGVLEIALKPGWKTYWRDPGDSGVPPQFDITPSTNIAGAELSFPPPQRHDDGYGQWAGYDHSVSLPVTFTLAQPDQPAVVDANVFLGMCETICIPVQTRLSVEPGADPDNAEDAAIVRAGVAALPGDAQSTFGIKVEPGDHETLVVEAVSPAEPSSLDFFVAGGQDYMFGTPKREERDGKVIFTVPILDRPTTTPTGDGLHYTLTSSNGAVAGLLPYP